MSSFNMLGEPGRADGVGVGDRRSKGRHSFQSHPESLNSTGVICELGKIIPTAAYV